MHGRAQDHYYQVLGIDRFASAEELRQAHRDLAQVWHPDRFAANPRLQRMANQKLREINEAYTILRSGGRAPSAPPAEPPAWPTSAVARWFYRGVQGVGAAAAVLGLIISAGAIHEWMTERQATSIVAELGRDAQGEGKTQPVHRRGQDSRAERPALSNGTELVEPRGRKGIGRVTISNQMDRDAVAMLVDSNAPDAVVRMVYVSAGRQVALDGIAPGIYRLQLSAGAEWNWKARDFTRDRTAARPVGPLSFTQIQSTRQVRGDQYRIVLRGDGPSGPEDEIFDGSMRA